MTESKPSKSARKREQQALKALGEQLIALADEQLDTLQLDDRLRDAIRDARRMKSHEALRRQKQFIGKLMRGVDPAPIRALFDKLRASDRRDKRIFADAERWRDRLVQERDAALPAFEAHAGRAAPELARLLTDLERSHSDREDRTLKRKIFRVVHRTLAAASADE
ncbi:MAG: ribosome biogenesis factor YjgA [Woeseiaceae bacterium]|nr:ribosome biogenesis factor YjgA [Woeseiaceae bacterium]